VRRRNGFLGGREPALGIANRQDDLGIGVIVREAL